MREFLYFRFTREQASQLGLLICANCQWPKNNHFDWGQSAMNSECKKYIETAAVGTIVNKDVQFK